MRIIFSCFLFFNFCLVFPQGSTFIEEQIEPKIDSLYREDQFFFSFTYNTLVSNPEGLSLNKFSTGYSAGFLRDMPINKTRTVAIAAGLGFTYNNYRQNLAITGTNKAAVYTIVGASSLLDSNKFSNLLVDFPIEFRWRTSTYESYAFWRIYGGVKFSYLLFDKSVLNDASGKTVLTNNHDFNRFLYGVYISSGYNAINLYAFYGLNSLFKNTVEVNGQKLGVKSLNIGLIFYIL